MAKKKSKAEVIERLQNVVDDLREDVARGNASIPLAGATVTLRARRGSDTEFVMSVGGREFRQSFVGTYIDIQAFGAAVSAATVADPPVDPVEDEEDEPV